MISFSSSGSLKNTEAFLRKAAKVKVMDILRANAQRGVVALSRSTPSETGLAAGSWGFEVGRKGGGYFIAWTNSDVESGFPVSIMLQLGYGTGTGGYVSGRDYINPAMKPIFDDIADKAWKAVTSP